jgi:hypothetical protein
MCFQVERALFDEMWGRAAAAELLWISAGLVKLSVLPISVKHLAQHVYELSSAVVLAVKHASFVASALLMCR